MCDTMMVFCICVKDSVHLLYSSMAQYISIQFVEKLLVINFSMIPHVVSICNIIVVVSISTLKKKMLQFFF